MCVCVSPLFNFVCISAATNNCHPTHPHPLPSRLKGKRRRKKKRKPTNQTNSPEGGYLHIQDSTIGKS